MESLNQNLLSLNLTDHIMTNHTNDSTTGACYPRLHFLQSPATHIFGILFGIETVISFIGNLFVLIILFFTGFHSQSNRFFASLAVSDFLTGLILSPVTTYQLLNTSGRLSCLMDEIRFYATVVLGGSSTLSLAVITYDRYILLTKFNNYDKYMTKLKTTILLLFIWIFQQYQYIRLLESMYNWQLDY